MKKFFSLILTLIMIAGLSNTALASNLSMDAENDDHIKSVEFIYDVVNSTAWQTMERPDRIAACQIPSEQLDNLSTPELVQAVLAFPFFVDIYAFDSIDTGYACLLSECRALQTLVTRPDRADAILSIYESSNVVTNINSDYEAEQFSHLWNLEMLILQDDFIDIMTENQKDALVGIAESKYLIKQENSKMSNSVELSAYKYAQSNQIIKPELILKENHQFDFFYAVESSYKAGGAYEIENKKLYLKTSDGKYVFVFSIKSKTLLFVLDESILPPGFINVEDEAIFIPINESHKKADNPKVLYGYPLFCAPG